MKAQSLQRIQNAVTPDIIKWGECLPDNGISSLVKQDLQIKIKHEDIFNAPYVQKVLLNYHAKDDENANLMVMTNALSFKMDMLFMGIRSTGRRNGQIVANIVGIELGNCAISPFGDGLAYLNLKQVRIDSEWLGGTVTGELHVLFLNRSICRRWSAMFTDNREQQRAQELAVKSRQNKEWLEDLTGTSFQSVRWTAASLIRMFIPYRRDL